MNLETEWLNTRTKYADAAMSVRTNIGIKKIRQYCDYNLYKGHNNSINTHITAYVLNETDDFCYHNNLMAFRQ